jgi:hypothetical protein
MPYRRKTPMNRPPTALAAALAAALLTLSLAGCGGSRERTTGATAQAPPVVNEALHLTLDPPAGAGFELTANAGTTLELLRPAADGRLPATLTFEAGAPEPNVNLVDAVNRQKAAIEARPNGRFLGQVQLMSQIGNAFSTRGRYPGDDGREVEELRLFAIHPDGDRLLTLTYRYPAVPGETKERIEEAMGALGLVRPSATKASAGGGS